MLNQFAGGNFLVRHTMLKRQILGMLQFAGVDLSDRVPLVVDSLCVQIELGQLRSDANDLQQRLRLLFRRGVQELRQVECQLPDQLIQQRLSGLVAVLVVDLQRGVLALAGNDQPVVQLNADARVRHRPLTLGIGWLVPVAPQCPHDGIQNGRLTLAVPSTDDRQTNLRRLHLDRLHPLHVLNLEPIDPYHACYLTTGTGRYPMNRLQCRHTVRIHSPLVDG